MANAVIGAKAYWISPFRLRELRLAAPFIDRVSARARAGGAATLGAASETAYDMLCVLAVGIEGVDADQLAAEASVEELSALRAAFDQVMVEAGLKPEREGAQPGEPQLGEPQPGEQAAATPDGSSPPNLSANGSTTSPPNSSPADAATGTASNAASI